MRYLACTIVLVLLTGCRAPAEGPLKSVLIVYSDETEDVVDSWAEDIQIYIETVTVEPVFDFSFARTDEFGGSLRNRRTILFLAGSESDIPEELERSPDGVFRGYDTWALGQTVLGVVTDGTVASSLVSSLLEEAYDWQMYNYIYGSFVTTQMSSPERIDSLLTLGFSVDVPKSYRLESWRPEDGFVQYQRQVSDNCLLILSFLWRSTVAESTSDDAILRREAMARRFFYDASADSVDRDKVLAERFTLNTMQGWRLTGVWRNPEHLNAGAFTTYVLDHDGYRYILDMEVYNPGREKEPYIREGWTIMNSFVPED